MDDGLFGVLGVVLCFWRFVDLVELLRGVVLCLFRVGFDGFRLLYEGLMDLLW